MRKFFKIAAAAVCAAGVAVMCTACNNSVQISIDGDGYLIVNGEKTDIKNPDDGKSAYELYVKENPSYSGSEQQWLEDIASGRLASEREYTLISCGKTNGAHVEAGGVVSDGSVLSLSNSIIALNSPAVLPLGEGAEWTISFKGIVMPDGNGGGQFLTSTAYGTNGRIYTGVNGTNNVMFIGVCIGDTYANYCWDVPFSVLSGEHEYIISYENGEYLLTIDGGTAMQITSVNVNQANRTSVDSEKACAELNSKIRAVTGQDYIVFSHMGASTHLCTGKYAYFNIKTSSIYGYSALNEHPLGGKIVYYLGSSVTRGHGGNTDGTSFAEYTASLTGGTYLKEAISGTNLAVVGGRNDSYAERLSKFDFNNRPDVLVVQLSTNDFANNVTAGSVSESDFSGDMDKQTITGAIEYIVATVNELSPETKVVIYTCNLGETWSKYREYGEYVNGTLKQLESKWSAILSILDLYNADYIKVSSYLQGDALHPQKEGYAQVFTPAFINLLESIL